MAENKQAGKTNKFDPVHYLGFLPGADERTNLFKQEFYSMLVERGLGYMYKKNYDVDPDSPILRTVEDEDIEFIEDKYKTKNPKKVIIVGAGMSGLAAAYELKRAGHKVGPSLKRKQKILSSGTKKEKRV